MQVIAQQGDTIDQLCHRHLGGTATVTEQVLELNQGLAALGAILPMGTKMELPDLVPDKKDNTLIQLWD